MLADAALQRRHLNMLLRKIVKELLEGCWDPAQELLAIGVLYWESLVSSYFVVYYTFGRHPGVPVLELLLGLVAYLDSWVSLVALPGVVPTTPQFSA